MNPSTDDVPVSWLLAFEPHLSAPARKDVQAIRGIVACFPGESLPQIEKLIKTYVKDMRTSVPQMVQRAQALCQAEARDTDDDFLVDAKRMTATNLKSLGKRLGLELAGKKDEMLSDLQNWIESGGRIAPPTKKEREAAAAQKFSARLHEPIQRVTHDNVSQLLDLVDEAYAALSSSEFSEFAQQVGVTVNGAKGAKRKQLKDFVKRLAVTHTQTQF